MKIVNDLIAEVRRLRKREKMLQKGIYAAKHLLIVATGPDDGPTSWTETKDRFLQLFEDVDSSCLR